MKRTALKRKTPLKAKHKKPAKKKAKRNLPAISTMRNKCDKLLTPIIKQLYPTSIFSGKPTEVAHHFVHKSKSNALRYHIPNLIPLTHAEHQALHANESYYAAQIVRIRGIDWFNELEAKKREFVKVDVHWYIENYERLNLML